MATRSLPAPEPELFGLSEVRRVHELVETGRKGFRTVLLPDR
jgi:hypothetical protein